MYRVDEDYEMESREKWLASTQVADYVEDRDLTGLSELAEMHLEENSTGESDE